MAKDFSLRDRFISQGTLSDPLGIPDPAFSLPGTLNWMRALAILVDAGGIAPASMKAHFTGTSKAALSDQAINTVYEQLLMALHHLASIRAMGGNGKRIDTARSAIVTWYYGIYHAASAMIAAKDGCCQENHTETANAWDRQFAVPGLVPEPFSWRVSTLVTKDVAAEIDKLRRGNKHGLNSWPADTAEALGACMAYLKGSAEWRAEYIEEDLKRKELKALKLDNFRTRQAQELRDARLRSKGFGFVHQAFRYRGKANYREALFISYGKGIEAQLADFHADLDKVLSAFLAVAGAFCARRIGKAHWNDYHTDLTSNTSFCVKPAEIWSCL